MDLRAYGSMQGAGDTSGLVFRPLSLSDYPGIRSLILSESPEGLSDYDSEERIDAFLKRNRGFCFAAVSDKGIIGIIMCGCDGRSARIYHLIVDPFWRRKGVAHTLIGLSYDALKSEGIGVVDVLIFREDPGAEFWESEGFRDREDLSYRDFSLDGDF